MEQFLFDRKAALRHKSLIYNCFFIAFKQPDGLAKRQLFPFWKQLNQAQSITRLGQKMHILPISKMETTEKK